jgi:predicted dehydrogenase
LQTCSTNFCGRDEASEKETAERFGFKEWETDWRKVIEREDIDIIDIVTPNNLHAEIAIAAANAGKHIICEKPLAMNTKQAEEMLKAVQKSGVTAMLCHNYRFVPAVVYAKKLIDEGRLGRIFHARCTYLQDWGMDDGGSFVISWRYDKESAGSGAHGDIASHSLDLARFLLCEVKEVVGTLETFKSQREHNGEVQKVEIDDASIFLAGFQNGALGTFEATRFAKGNRNGNRF